MQAQGGHRDYSVNVTASNSDPEVSDSKTHTWGLSLKVTLSLTPVLTCSGQCQLGGEMGLVHLQLSTTGWGPGVPSSWSLQPVILHSCPWILRGQRSWGLGIALDCMYVCVCIHVHVHVHIHAVCTCAHVCACVHTCIHGYAYVSVHMSACMCTHACMRTLRLECRDSGRGPRAVAVKIL